MYYFIDLCCGFGSLTKAFERTGAFKCVLAADINENMRNHYNYLLKRKPLGDIFDEKVLKVIKDTPYDILCASTVKLNEEIFYRLLEIIEIEQPICFVIEMDNSLMTPGFCKTVEYFCKENLYKFCGYNGNVENITLNLADFGVPEHSERVFCICCKPEWLRSHDDVFLQLNKSHDYECYKFKEYNPDKFPEQRNGTDWGFGSSFRFLTNTPDKDKKTIIEGATPIPMACQVALTLMGWLI